MPTGLIPQRQLYAVPEPQLVVDGPEIVFDDVFAGADFIGDLFVLETLSDEFDDPMFPLVGLGSAIFPSKQSCLLYNSVASFTRLTPP